MIIALYILVSITAIVTSYQIGGRRRISRSQHAMDVALENLMAAQEILNTANEELVYMHSANVGFIIEALDFHVRETGKTLDPDHAAIVESIRPYYETQTIH